MTGKRVEGKPVVMRINFNIQQACPHLASEQHNRKVESASHTFIGLKIKIRQSKIHLHISFG